MSELLKLIERTKTEFQVVRGKTFLSLRGTAQLAGVTNDDIQGLFFQMSKNNIPDVFVRKFGQEKCQLDALEVLRCGAVPTSYLVAVLRHFALAFRVPRAYAMFDYFSQLAVEPNPKLISTAEAMNTIDRLTQPLSPSPKCKQKNKTFVGLESVICARLKEELGALSEVVTPSGRIDLLTEDFVIEVKKAEKWKDGVGQLQAYQVYYPTHQKRLHLFGKLGDKLLDIKHVCSLLSIELTIES